MTDLIKCRFCEWSTPRFTTNKKGERKNAAGRLRNHVAWKHRQEYREIVDQLDEEMEMKEREE